MADIAISDLAVTATGVSPTDLFVISKDIGGGLWQSQKVPGQVILDLFTVVNLYNNNGQLTSARTVDGNAANYDFSILNIGAFTVNTNAGVEIEDVGGGKLDISDSIESYSPSGTTSQSDGAINTISLLDNNLKSTNGNVTIESTSSSKNISLVTNANGAVVLPVGADPETDILTPIDGMMKYSNLRGGNVFRENGAWVRYSMFNNMIIVKSATDFGVIDSTKEYFIDGDIDMGAVSVEIPAGGINIKGYGFKNSNLSSSEDNYTMFTHANGGCGDINIQGVSFEVTGSNSKVMYVIADTGNEVFEISKVNFNNCTDIGEVYGFRQGRETETGRFGGTPSLKLSGTWAGGYAITGSIARGLIDGAYALYEEGTAFNMASRFKSDQNLDLNSTVAFLDFGTINFINPSTLQLSGCIVSRNGVFNAGDTTIIPNLNPGALPCSWSNNEGIGNTFVGGQLRITKETTTTVSSSGVFYDLDGTYTASDLQHFVSSANGQLKHLGDSPREYKVIVNAILDCAGGDEVDLKVVIWDDSAAGFVDGKTIRRVINNLQGGRDVAYFNLIDNIILR